MKRAGDPLLRKTKAELVAALRDAQERLRSLEGAAVVPGDAIVVEFDDRLRRFIDLFPFMIYVKDREGRFLVANRATHEAYGFATGALAGMLQSDTHLSAVAVHRYNAADLEVIDQARRHDSPGAPFTTAAGEERVIDYIKVPWGAAPDESTAVLVIGFDVTERTRFETTLLRQERFATLGQVTATVNHELRNPLGSIHASLQVLQKITATDDRRAQAALDRIDRSVVRCARLIDQTLDFTRLRALDPETVELNGWLRDVLAEQARPEGLTLVERLHAGAIEVSIDTERMRQAIVNVWENACHALAEHARSPRARAGATITVTTSRQGERCELMVVDNGEGISAPDLPHVFEPLFSTKSFGTGLGLPAVRQVLEQHGGGAVVRSRVEHGTTVLLWFPARARD